MSTRGFYGFRKDGIDKLTYNHFDSYPDHLGRKIVTFIKTMGAARLSALYDRILMVSNDVPPTREQIALCEGRDWAEFGVSEQSESDWYCLLYYLQGNFDMYEKLMEDNDATIFLLKRPCAVQDSLEMEYGYLINLDENVLEFYIGFQTKPDPDNRYGCTPDKNGYYPCKCVKKFPLGNLPATLTVVDQMNSAEKEVD